MGKPLLFKNLLQTELMRARGDGLTRALAELAKKMKYRFAVSNTALGRHAQMSGAEHIVNAQERDFETIRPKVGLIWDHYSVYVACVEMDKAYDALEGENKKLQKELQETDQLARSYRQRYDSADNKYRAQVSMNHALLEILKEAVPLIKDTKRGKSFKETIKNLEKNL